MSKSRRGAYTMGSGRTFYPDEPEDLAYLRQLARETRGDPDRWPELNLRIWRRPETGVTYRSGCPILGDDPAQEYSQ